MGILLSHPTANGVEYESSCGYVDPIGDSISIGYIMTPLSRRKVFDTMLARVEAQGLEFESDADFRALVEEWIEGKLEIGELREVYANLLRSRNRRLNQ